MDFLMIISLLQEVCSTRRKGTYTAYEDGVFSPYAGGSGGGSSDWDDITNKPSIRAGKGENSVVIGDPDPSDDTSVYTLRITRTQEDLSSNTIHFTTEDMLPSDTTIRNYGVFYFNNTENNGNVVYSRIRSISKSDGTLSIYGTILGGLPKDKEAKIYYKHKMAVGELSSAEGAYTFAGGSRSHAEGSRSGASGEISHAEGQNTVAVGNYSHAEGNGTIASADSQHVQGKFNVEDTSKIYADIVGNGTSSNRSNAYTLDWNGNGWFAGKVTAGAAPTNDMDLATKKYVDDSNKVVPVRIITNAAFSDVINSTLTAEEIRSNFGAGVPMVFTILIPFADGDGIPFDAFVIANYIGQMQANLSETLNGPAMEFKKNGVTHHVNVMTTGISLAKDPTTT